MFILFVYYFDKFSFILPRIAIRWCYLKIFLFASCHVILLFIRFANFNHILLINLFTFSTLSFARRPLFFLSRWLSIFVATSFFLCKNLFLTVQGRRRFFNCPSCQKLNMGVIGRVWNALKGDASKLGPWSIWEINI